MSMRIVFDIGGTSTRIAPVAGSGIGDARKIPTQKKPEEWIGAFVPIAREFAGERAIEVAAGGFPGIIADGRVQEAPNLQQWEDFRLEEELSKALGGVPVIVRNDADMAALGEALFGAGKGKRVVAYAGVGTGLGSGRVVGGTVDTGARKLEAGHQIIDVKTLTRLDELVTGRAFEKRFGAHPREAPRSAYEEMTPILAVGLHNIILHWSPDTLVIGGSMVYGVNGYRIRDIAEALKKIPYKLPMMPEIRTSALKEESGLYGALELATGRLGV